VVARLGQEARQLADHGVVALPVGLLRLGQHPRTDEGRSAAFLLVPELLQVCGREPRRSREEVRADAQPAVLELEMRAPAAAHPAQVERRAEAVGGAMGLQHSQHVLQGRRVLAQDPGTVLAQDREPMQDDRLAAGENRPQPPRVELRSELQVDRHASACRVRRPALLCTSPHGPLRWMYPALPWRARLLDHTARPLQTGGSWRIR